MTHIEKSVLVPFADQQMFELVDRVEDYPHFLPWCGGADVTLREANRLVATLHIHYHGIRQSFSTENCRTVPSRITMQLQEGPFRQLTGEWRFLRLDEKACKVVFNLQYEFSSRMLETLIGPVFHHIANTFVDAFVRRAEEIYGDD